MLDKVSDARIEAEYQRRFSLKPGDAVSKSEDAARHLMPLLSKETSRECFAVIFLNGANKFVACEVLFKGTLTSSAVYPRELIKRAFDLDAAAVICGHNHPSGNLNPSQDDIQITQRIKSACSAVDLSLHDHLIIAGGKWYSMADKGII